MNRFRRLSILLLLIAGWAAADLRVARAGFLVNFGAYMSPENSFSFRFGKNGKYFGNMDMLGWGPNWAWAPPSKVAYSQNGVIDVTTQFLENPSIQLNEHVSKTAPDTLTLKYTLSAEQDRALTQLSDVFSFVGPYNSGLIDVTLADGTAGDPLTIPTKMSGFDGPIAKLVFHVKDIGDLTATFDPPLSPHVENNGLRMRLAHDKFPAGTQVFTVTLKFPGEFALMADKMNMTNYVKPMADDHWFEWKPANDVGPSVIGMEDWLEAPAGKHGAVKIDAKGHFAFADGKSVKFWGTNLAYTQNTPEKAQAEQTAARFAKYGINCVRMHKFTSPGQGIGTEASATDFDAAGLDKLDYFTAQLKKRGVYYGWSHTYTFLARAGDADKFLDYDELSTIGKGNTYGLINGAPDVQDVMIGMVVALLKHKNPYTGMTYADDPALAFLEVQNEDDIFFYTFSVMDKFPKYKQAMSERFAEWLEAKYKTPDALATAWGTPASNAKVIPPTDFQTNPWFFGDDNMARQTDAGAKQRLIDNALFFHDEQNKFYSKFVKAVRAAGYKGPINGSPWQAPTTLPDLLNLKSDAMVGYIDRHNYFGDEGLFSSMLSQPGSGYFGSGLQRVSGHPFALSEWCHVYPNMMAAEGPPIVAAYGLGLQGWDASYQFQSYSSNPGFRADAGHAPWDIWNADVPTQIGQFPALARMIYRGDVKEGEPIAVRRVSDEQLQTAKFDFEDKVTQNGDIKKFEGSVPPEALAAGRVSVEFTKTTQTSTFPDMAKFGIADKRIASNTGQLVWDYKDKGYFTVATPGTVAVVGSAQAVDFKAGGVGIQLKSPYASVFATSSEPGTTLADCKTALVTVVGKECNAGFRYFRVDNHIIDNGQGPIMVEGIEVGLKFTDRKVKQVNVLDQDGRIVDGAVLAPSADGSYALNTGRDKTVYYQIVFG